MYPYDHVCEFVCMNVYVMCMCVGVHVYTCDVCVCQYKCTYSMHCIQIDITYSIMYMINVLLYITVLYQYIIHYVYIYFASYVQVYYCSSIVVSIQNNIYVIYVCTHILMQVFVRCSTCTALLQYCTGKDSTLQYCRCICNDCTEHVPVSTVRVQVCVQYNVQLLYSMLM